MSECRAAIAESALAAQGWDLDRARKLKLPLGATRLVLKDESLASFKTCRHAVPPSRRFTVGTNENDYD